MDNLSTTMLDEAPDEELDKLDVEALDALFWKVNDELTTAKRRDHRIYQIMERRYAAKASEALLHDGRDTGTVHLTDGRYDVTVIRPKRVKWDQAKLREALDRIDPETARHIARIDIKIDERKFDALMSDTQAVLREARTVETGKASYALNERKAA